MRRHRGFTLVELMFVFAIAGAITTMAFLGIGSLKRDGRDKERMTDRDNIGTAIKSYQSAKEGDISALTSANLLTTLIDGGYLQSAEATTDPLSKTDYNVMDSTDCSTDLGSTPGKPTESHAAGMQFVPTGKSFSLGVCLEAGTLNDKNFEM